MPVDSAIMDLARALARRRARAYAARPADERDLGPSIVPRHDDAAPLAGGDDGESHGHPPGRALRAV